MLAHVEFPAKETTPCIRVQDVVRALFHELEPVGERLVVGHCRGQLTGNEVYEFAWDPREVADLVTCCGI